MADDLLPCPFCGVEPMPDYSAIIGEDGYHFHCQNGDCPAWPNVSGATEAEAIAAWNTRTQAAAAANAREAELQRIVDFNVGFNLDLLDDNAALRISKYEMHKLLKDALEIINDQMPGEFLEWEEATRAALSASEGEAPHA